MEKQVNTITVNNMSNKNSKLYISDYTEAEKVAPLYGDVEVLIADDKEKVDGYEKSGNQSSEYYKK